ncbi:GNAT family N-acetyltransferase [Ferrimonas futtsuensis]|uniref:GNAT family N-acetyltransferase n=1 Tax=Ferrimonas futtsuensis TaxID=364764 RepID=UPI00042272D7|nr:GNAT family N-acetyltransferase [Ferrimonas futtsuensis]
MFHPLTTSRTKIRMLTAEDGFLIQDYYRDNRDHLRAWEPQRSESFFHLNHQLELIRVAQLEWEDRRSLRLVALAPDEQEILAVVNLTNLVFGPFQAANLGYSVSHRHQGKGVMREVLVPVLAFAFGELGLHRVMANYQPNNRRSEQLLAGLGFTREGYAKDYLKIDGQWRDHVLTALLAC